MAWQILLHDKVRTWFLSLCREDPESAACVAAIIDKLADDGPTLGCPLVERGLASKHHTMKELNPGSDSTNPIRILFSFDDNKQGVLLATGGTGGAWRQDYIDDMKLADDRFDEHLAKLVSRSQQGDDR